VQRYTRFDRRRLAGLEGGGGGGSTVDAPMDSNILLTIPGQGLVDSVVAPSQLWNLEKKKKWKGN
jgi:hypothetical protein